jgi:hypothetical protein
MLDGSIGMPRQPKLNHKETKHWKSTADYLIDMQNTTDTYWWISNWCRVIAFQW